MEESQCISRNLFSSKLSSSDNGKNIFFCAQFGTTPWRVVSFTPRSLYPLLKNSRCTSDGRLDGYQRQCGLCLEEKCLLPVPGIELLLLSHPLRSGRLWTIINMHLKDLTLGPKCESLSVVSSSRVSGCIPFHVESFHLLDFRNEVQ
jgi:hypothetical protein